MSSLRFLEQVLILNIVASILYVESNGDETELEPIKIIYKDASLNEEETTETWRKILSDPLTADEHILNGIKEGKQHI